jgi:hypothetical protein
LRGKLYLNKGESERSNRSGSSSFPPITFNNAHCDERRESVWRRQDRDFEAEPVMSIGDENFERREFERRATQIEAVLHLDRPVDGHIINASLGGFLFAPPVEAEEGRAGTLEFLGSATAVPVTVIHSTDLGTHLRLEVDEDVYMQLASMSDEMAAMLIIATGIKP